GVCCERRELHHARRLSLSGSAAHVRGFGHAARRSGCWRSRPLVMLLERQHTAVTRQRFYTRAGAPAMADALSAAVPTFAPGHEPADHECPRAAAPTWPYAHRTMADVMADEGGKVAL